jgi:hypothetical protein
VAAVPHDNPPHVTKSKLLLDGACLPRGVHDGLGRSLEAQKVEHAWKLASRERATVVKIGFEERLLQLCGDEVRRLALGVGMHLLLQFGEILLLYVSLQPVGAAVVHGDQNGAVVVNLVHSTRRTLLNFAAGLIFKELLGNKPIVKVPQ